MRAHDATERSVGGSWDGQVADDDRLERHRHLHFAGQVRVVEPVGVSDALVRREFDVLAAEGMALPRGEIAERHSVPSADFRVQFVDRAGEPVGRQPFGHGVRIEEGAKYLLRLGGEDAMQTDGIALGHDGIFSVTERSLSHDFAG